MLIKMVFLLYFYFFIEEMRGRSFIQRPDKKKLVLCDNKRSLYIQGGSTQIKRQALLQQHVNKNIDQQNKQTVEKKGQVVLQVKRRLSENLQKREKQKLKINERVTTQEHFQTLSNSKKTQMLKSLSPLKHRASNLKKTEIIHHNQTSFKQSCFEDQISDIFRILMDSYLIQAKTPLQIWMKKDNFLQLINLVLMSLIQSQHETKFQEFCLLSLRQTLKKINIKVNSIQNSKKRERMGLHMCTFSLKYENAAYKKQIDSYHQSIIDLKNQIQILQLTINNKKEQLQNITEVCQEKQQITIDFQRKYFELVENFQSKTFKLEEVQQYLTQKQVLMKSAAEKADSILNFVERQQEKKILIWVSEAYKQIQSDLYEYATYLQCNAMASSLTWEPKPFRAVEKWVYEEMERVNSFVMSPAESSQDKATKMKDFITNTTRKFRTKDEEMMKITDFKTECIKKFIKMMEKWLQNWELKQEYLVSLREEFALRSQKIGELFSKLQAMERLQDKDFDCNEVRQLGKALQEQWKNVELNYKYGNSFY